MADYSGILYGMVAVFVIIAETSAQCNYPLEWRSVHWANKRITPKPIELELLTFKESYSYISNTTHPNLESKKLTCSAEEAVNAEKRYLIESYETDPDTKYCVEQSRVSGGANTANKVILQRRQPISGSAVATIDQCKADISPLSVFSVFLTVSSSTQQIDTSVKCPFPNIPYLVTFTTDGGAEFCTGSSTKNSVLSVNNDIISILACEAKTFGTLPLTGVLKCRATIDPTDLGEPDNSNGDIVILQWQTESNDETFMYCVRYKIEANNNVVLSIDLTSHTEAACTAGHRFDHFGEVGTGANKRQHIRMYWKFDGSLTSSKFTMSTRSTIRGTPPQSTSPVTGTTRGTSAPTASPSASDMFFQFTMDGTVTAENLEEFKNGLKTKVADTSQVDPSRIGDIVMDEGLEGNSVVTFTMKADSSGPSQTATESKLRAIINTGQYDINLMKVEKNTLYTWSATDNCPDSKCLNDGTCWMIQGKYSCRCQDGYGGKYCDVESEPQISKGGMPTTTIIIIAVVIVVVIIIVIVVVLIVMKKRAKSSGSTDSESGYDNKISMDDKDRELYSTINKRPKAYHEKSFTSLESSDDYGERTGIHL